jgi:ribosomal protein L3
MGWDQVTLKNIRVIDKITQGNEQLLLLKGSIPGSYNGYIKIFA